MSTEDQPPPDLVVSYYTSMSKFWQPTLLLTDFNDSPIIETTVCGRNLVAVRMGGQISVFENMCRHFQAKMSLGELARIGRTRMFCGASTMDGLTMRRGYARKFPS